MTLMATCEPGDTVLIIGPCWSSYFEICHMLHLRVWYKNDLPRHIFNSVSAVLFNNPNNPTGRVYDKEFCDKLHQVCVECNCWLISDEIYSDIVYDNIHLESMKNKENVIYINGFSKNYCLTGWRFGYAISDSELIK